MVKLCGEVFREAETRDTVLVPSRFGIIGISPVISELRDRIDRFARLQAPVLIRGESGTGKELTARALHEASDRCQEPFIIVNCPAIPEKLFESELFGYRAGAFTGAEHDYMGRIELAGEGTLFLDEVGELAPVVQAKLLRFLETGEYQRLGEKQLRRSRARIVTATHRDLAQAREFRQDLHHRLRRLELNLPPLSRHREDIRYLARHHVRQLNMQDGQGWKRLLPEVESRLEQEDFPGNVRDLFNLVGHAWHEALQEIDLAALTRARRRVTDEQPSIEVHWKDAVPADPAAGLPVRFESSGDWRLDFKADGVSLKLLQERVAVQAVRQAFQHFEGDVDQVARFLTMSRRSIYRYLDRGRGKGMDETSL